MITIRHSCYRYMKMTNFVSALVLFLVVTSASVHKKSNVVAALDPPLSTAGVWSLDPSQSDSLRPFLFHCGVPRLIAPLLASAFNEDKLYIRQSNKLKSVSVELKRQGWKLPVKLQTDATYEVNQSIHVETPRGPQECLILEFSNAKLIIQKKGPSANEQIDEEYNLINDDTLLQILRHRNGDTTNIELTRLFRRDYD